MNHRVMISACGLLLLLLCIGLGCKEQSSKASQLIDTNFFEIQTLRGGMVLRLYDETPQHRDNFKRLVADQAYDSTLFHRVMSKFMIQGGDPNSRDGDPMNDGGGGPGYTVPAEIRPDLYHKRGALAAARLRDSDNPARASSGSQFYIVHGAIYPDEILDQMEERLRQSIPDSSFSFSEEARKVYTTQGGTPNLDGAYTVFGELVEGLHVLDDIARVATGADIGQRDPPLSTRPLESVWMIVRPLPDYAY